MAKVLAPFFAVAAWGNLGRILTFQRRRGMPTVYPYTTPKLPNTEAQLAQRASVASAVSSWKALPAGSQVWWNEKAVGMATTGYNLYLKNYLLGLL